MMKRLVLVVGILLLAMSLVFAQETVITLSQDQTFTKTVNGVAREITVVDAKYDGDLHCFVSFDGDVIWIKKGDTGTLNDIDVTVNEVTIDPVETGTNDNCELRIEASQPETQGYEEYLSGDEEPVVASGGPCADGVLDIFNGETDIDCGPGCSPCTDGKKCRLNADCVSKLCRNLVCTDRLVDYFCTNSRLDADNFESDLDCGGPCLKCKGDQRCNSGLDCQSTVCTRGVCIDATRQQLCSNYVKDADNGETDIDCGGPCKQCPVGDACSADSDCVSGNCDSGKCLPAGEKKGPAVEAPSEVEDDSEEEVPEDNVTEEEVTVEEEEVSCAEDHEMNFYKKTVISDDPLMDDECVDSNTLLFYFCSDGAVDSLEYICPAGCSDGACVEIVPEGSTARKNTVLLYSTSTIARSNWIKKTRLIMQIEGDDKTDGVMFFNVIRKPVTVKLDDKELSEDKDWIFEDNTLKLMYIHSVHKLEIDFGPDPVERVVEAVPVLEEPSIVEEPLEETGVNLYFILGGILIVVLIVGMLLMKMKKPNVEEHILDPNVERLTIYIQASLNKGFKPEQVRQSLVSAGWKQELVDKAFEYLKR